MSMDFKSIVSKIAPILGTAIGGPLGGAAVDLIGNVFGLSDKTEESIKAAITRATPEQLLALKQAESEFKLKVMELNQKAVEAGYINTQVMYKTEVEDRSSARQREVQTGDVWTPRILAGIVLIATFICEGWVLTHAIPPGSEMLVGRVLGTMDAALLAVLYYYFGSSSGSAAKNNLINK